MKRIILNLFFYAGGAMLLAATAFPSAANAQRRDYMTDAESDIVRFEQEIDRRIGVLVMMIDRRFAVLNNQPSPIKKDSEKWGETPEGTRLELLSDINKLIQKAVDDIDDVAAHNRMDSKLFPKAMRQLAEAANRYLPQLKTAYDRAETDKEKGVILNAMDLSNQIIEASAKVPKEAAKEEKKKKT